MFLLLLVQFGYVDFLLPDPVLVVGRPRSLRPATTMGCTVSIHSCAARGDASALLFDDANPHPLDAFFGSVRMAAASTFRSRCRWL